MQQHTLSRADAGVYLTGVADQVNAARRDSRPDIARSVAAQVAADAHPAVAELLDERT